MAEMQLTSCFSLKAKMETIEARQRSLMLLVYFRRSYGFSCQDAQQGLYKTKCDMNARKYVRRRIGLDRTMSYWFSMGFPFLVCGVKKELASL